MTTTTIPSLTVTVLENATLFEGPDTVYRYDIAAAGIIEGWAVPAVVDQARQLCGLEWPEVDVIIDGDEAVTEMLTRTFIAKGVSSYPVEALREHPLTPPEPDPVTRPRSGRRVRQGYGVRPLHLVLTVALVGVVAGGWLLLADPSQRSAPQVPERTAPPAPAAVTPTQASTSVAPDSVLEVEGLIIGVPHGFSTEPVESGHILSGPDPDLRVHISVDRLHGTDAGLVAAELERMIEADPALVRQDPGDWGARRTIDYTEVPGDESLVDWVTWFEGDRQISVGCHTRQQPTLPHRASCRSIIDNLIVE